MTLSKEEIKSIWAPRKGRRGIDIPENIYDKIHPVASSASMKTWGSHPLPEQMQYLYESGKHEPDQISAHFDGLPHPQAPNMKVGEYNQYKQAMKMYKENQS